MAIDLDETYNGRHIDEPEALAHCRAADERDDTDQDNQDDGGSYDRHDFDNDPDWR